METFLPSVSDSDTLSVIPLQLTIAMQLMHLQQHSTKSVRLHSLCISSRIQLILFAPHDNCIRLRFGWPNTHWHRHTHTDIHAVYFTVRHTVPCVHARTISNQFALIWIFAKTKVQTERDNSMRLSAQNSGLHMYVCMATLYVTVCGVECEQEMYAKEDVAFFA